MGSLLFILGSIVLIAGMAWVRHRAWSHTPITIGFVIALLLAVILGAGMIAIGIAIADIK